ncbi:MAG: hypothetical protein WCH74_08755, partial [Chloroflexota bacterium]
MTRHTPPATGRPRAIALIAGFALLAGLVAAPVAVAARSDTRTSTGGGPDSSWATAASWDGHTVPSAGGAPADLVSTPGPDFIGDPVVGDGGRMFIKGSTQPIAWEVDWHGASPTAAYEFKVVADDPNSGTDILLATVPATSATAYRYDWTIIQGPSGGWHVNLQLWSIGGPEIESRDSQTFDIAVAPSAPTITGFSPTAGPVGTLVT